MSLKVVTGGADGEIGRGKLGMGKLGMGEPKMGKVGRANMGSNIVGVAVTRGFSTYFVTTIEVGSCAKLRR
ncbi:hypothetical protein BGE01nite_37540 [Brevifollis gellanilyticus]|uniref:Uncharacterized protein n=1 Tax=Brevifollis gellanilyticus TaxID=748831 RepID=A0A512MCJ8_9BACT|nr:hypothetical protein BGE01nite_37540 [Brevifollis gellanilyticus]